MKDQDRIERALRFLGGYPPKLRDQARELLVTGQMGPRLQQLYPTRHEIRSNKALGEYVQDMRSRFMRKSAPLAKSEFNDRLHVIDNALGMHTTRQRQQGAKLRSRRELRISSLFKDAAPEFLLMIVAHELAHLKHAEHDRDFYRLCCHMDQDYHQHELDLRLSLALAEWDSQKGSTE